MDKKLLKNGLIAAGIMNISGVLIHSRGFTNTAINQADPVVMSNFGLLMIMVWGLAYLGAAAIQGSIKWLLGAFALEKLVYVAAWMMWHSENSVAKLFARDSMAGAFYCIYGINDLVFMLFFTWAFFRAHGERGVKCQS